MHVSILLFSLLLGVLLIGPRLTHPLRAEVLLTEGRTTETRYKERALLSPTPVRGAVLQTDRGARLLLGIGGTRIGLYEDTVLELVAMEKEKIVLRVKKGRIVVRSDRPLTILAFKEEKTIQSGEMISVIYYDFREVVETQTYVSAATFAGSSAEPFYQWFDEALRGEMFDDSRE